MFRGVKRGTSSATDPGERLGLGVARTTGDRGTFGPGSYNRRVSLAGKLERLPLRPGVYILKGRDGSILYVGKARVLRDRVRSYFQASRPADPWKAAMLAEIADLDLVVTDTEMEALALENNLIKRHRPPYNVKLRDDKNHPYLKLTLAEEYPRLHVVRRVGEDGNVYGGPYIPASVGRKTASLVHKLFGVRSCKERLDGRRPRALPSAPDKALCRPLRRGHLLASTSTGRPVTTRGCSSKGVPTRS